MHATGTKNVPTLVQELHLPLAFPSDGLEDQRVIQPQHQCCSILNWSDGGCDLAAAVARSDLFGMTDLLT